MSRLRRGRTFTTKPAPMRLVAGRFGRRPILTAESAMAISAELHRRRPYFTPEWTASPERDAGDALVDLFAWQLAAVAKRANQLPDRAQIEFLRAAGARPAVARPASAFVAFVVSAAAKQSVAVPRGFQVGAPSASDSGEIVTFETQNDVFAAPGEIAKTLFDRGRARRDLSALNVPGGSFAPLGESPQVGDSLWLGVKLPPEARLTLGLTLGIVVAPGRTPREVSAGALSPAPLDPVAMLQWEARYGAQFRPLIVDSDETRNLSRTGIVQLRLADPVAPTQMPEEKKPLAWIRVRLVHGSFREAPRLSLVRLNMARVRGVRTVRNEALQPTDVSDRRRFRLSGRPVAPESLEIVTDETTLAGDGLSDRSTETRWDRIADLEFAGPTDRVYELDSETGVLSFGDGRHGAELPPGFRNVRAVRYEVQTGAAGAVAADQITLMLNAAPLVTGVTNPLAASGGRDGEPLLQTVRRSRRSILSAGRSVAPAEYAASALSAPGADLGRAHAIPGYHPRFPGRRQPGVVGILAVALGKESGPPLPDELTLQAVAQHLNSVSAPAGVEIVVAAPRFKSVIAEVRFAAEPGTDWSRLAREIDERISQYLDPLQGGEDGQGWPFGGTLRYSALLDRLLSEDANADYQPPRSISRLRLVVDGVRQPECGDVPLPPDALFWPGEHQVIPSDPEVAR